MNLNTIESRVCYVGLTVIAAVFGTDAIVGVLAIAFGSPWPGGILSLCPDGTACGIALLLRGPVARSMTDPDSDPRIETWPLPILMSGAIGILGIYLVFRAGLLLFDAWPELKEIMIHYHGVEAAGVAFPLFVELALGVLWIAYAMRHGRDYRRGGIR